MSDEKEYHFIAISGSLRKGSYNTMALKALQLHAPSNIKIEQVHFNDIPFYCIPNNYRNRWYRW